jgi:ABC-2 type transport system ATP-binding protein
MMIGITVPDSGSVSLFDKPFTRKVLARVGYLPEERGLYKKMNVLDQLVFLGRLHYLSASVATERARTLSEKLQISEALSKKTEDLSKGMQQKIQFIAALLHNPDLIIMDEPFSGLDPVNAVLLMDTLLDLRREGKAVLFSTHRMDQVEKFCDNIALINRGHLVLSGSMGEIKSSYPRNRVHISFEGDDSFLRHPSVESVKRYSGQAEIKLRPSATLADDAQSLLARAVQHARITRFEVTEPTLEEIFIEKVQETSPAKSGLELSMDQLQEPERSYIDA